MEATQSGDARISQNQGRSERSRGDGPRPPHGARRHEAYKQQAAKDWVREHQDLAVIAAFALGVFVGVWTRG